MNEDRTGVIEEIVSRHRSRMARRAAAITGSEADAEDVVQETLLTIISGPHVLSGVERIGGWLLTSAKRRSMDAIRAASRRRKREASVGLEDLFEHTDPHELMEQEEFAQAVARAVKALPRANREAFVANALEMKTFKEISEESGVPIGTLMSRKKRAVDEIRARLAEDGYTI